MDATKHTLWYKKKNQKTWEAVGVYKNLQFLHEDKELLSDLGYQTQIETTFFSRF